MSVIKDEVVFKGRTVFNQIKLKPSGEASSNESNKWPKFMAVNENSSRINYYQVDYNEDEGIKFKSMWTMDFDKIHDFDFIGDFLVIADGELSEKQLLKISLQDRKPTNIPTKQVSSRGAWKLSCLESKQIIALYVKHTNDLHFYENFEHSFYVQSPFSGQISQLQITQDFLIIGQLEKHIVQVYKTNLTHKTLSAFIQIEGFWGNFAIHSALLYTSIMGSQKEVVVTNLKSKSQHHLEAETKFVPLVALDDRILLTKERHNNTTIHVFIIPAIDSVQSEMVN